MNTLMMARVTANASNQTASDPYPLSMADFVTARLDEDDARAHQASDSGPGSDEGWMVQRVRTDAETKRAILVLHRKRWAAFAVPTVCDAVQDRATLAQPYADHPEYQHKGTG